MYRLQRAAAAYSLRLSFAPSSNLPSSVLGLDLVTLGDDDHHNAGIASTKAKNASISHIATSLQQLHPLRPGHAAG
jgi:hypothetical protein